MSQKTASILLYVLFSLLLVIACALVEQGATWLNIRSLGGSLTSLGYLLLGFAAIASIVFVVLREWIFTPPLSPNTPTRSVPNESAPNLKLAGFQVINLDVHIKGSGDRRYIQPFAVIESGHRANCPIRFELWDANGNCVLTDSETWDLIPGVRTVNTRSWAPIAQNNALEGSELRIYCWDKLFADRIFREEETEGGRFRQYLTGDGELSDALVDLLDDAPVIDEDMSLDELL